MASGRLDDPRMFSDMIRSSDLVICADGGAGHIRRTGILPDVIVGDLDSIAPADQAFFTKNKVRFVRYPADKDATDTELAMSLAVEQGAEDITLIGGSGTRLDHTMANVFLLKKLVDRQISCRMVDSHNEIHLVTDRLEIEGRPGELVSVLPASERVTGVTMTGFLYPLNGAELVMGSTIGVSNRLVGQTARINVLSGTLIVFKSRD